MAKKSWSNPALRAMGIPKLSLPSRNWMIFWTALAGLTGGVVYDKHEQSKIREKWMKHVESLGQQTYPTGQLPRKLTIYIAPPPNDFLEESLRVFRKYIKPVLNASAIDYQVYTETRQGDIRMQVANTIRDLRREKAGIKESKQEEGDEKSAWKLNSLSKVSSFSKVKPADEEENLKARSELYTPKDVLGLYRVREPVEVVREDAENPTEAGGVICIGRGAYKEYITGLHEGLLGPLDKPEALVQEEKEAEKEREEKRKADAENGKTEEDETEKKAPVVKPYIRPEEYAQSELAREFDWSRTVTDANGVPTLFEQPVYVFPVPNLLGFSTIPRKIYRYYTKRFLADDYGSRTVAVVNNKHRDFKYKDSLAAKEEEVDWPKSWVEKGKGRNSEWVQELVVDERITERMRVYDPELQDASKETTIENSG